MADVPADLGTGAVYGGIGAACMAIIPALMRYWSRRADAHDRAHAEHIASLKTQHASEKSTLEATIVGFRAEIDQIRGEHTQLTKDVGRLTGRLEVVERQNADLLAANEQLRVQNAALQGDLAMTRTELAAVKNERDEVLQQNEVLAAELKQLRK